MVAGVHQIELFSWPDPVFLCASNMLILLLKPHFEQNKYSAYEASISNECNAHA